MLSEDFRKMNIQLAQAHPLLFCNRARLHRGPHRQVFVDGVGVVPPKRFKNEPALAAAKLQLDENSIAGAKAPTFNLFLRHD
jgi:hypothetical protein